MTENDIQKKISVRFDLTTSTPSTSSVEYARRRELINDGERMFREAHSWSFLRKTASLSTTASQAYVTLPSGYRKNKADFDETEMIEINNTFYKLVKPNQKNNYVDTFPLAWVTGSDAEGYQLNISPTPDGVYSFDFNYYTKNMATLTDGSTEIEFLTNTDDITKVSNPLYLVHYVLSELYPSDDDLENRGITEMTKAKDILLKCIEEDVESDVNSDLAIQDVDDARGYAPIGGYQNE